MLFSKLSKEGTGLLYPALGQDWHCDIQPPAAGSLTGNTDTAKPPERWLPRQTESEVMAQVQCTFCTGPTASQFSNHISPDWESRTASFHSHDKDKAPESEGCSLGSSNELLETVLERGTKTVAAAGWQTQKSKSIYYISFGLLEKCISCGVWASLINFQFCPSTIHNYKTN